MENITLTTKDGEKLAGLLWVGDGPRFGRDRRGGPNAVLLLHQMPLTKESWIELAERLNERGFTVLAIDFRGHGESGGGDYHQFSSEEHQKYYFDADAAMNYLQGRFPLGQIFLGGASIGANIALQLMSEYHELPKGFALSAGLDYYGVRAEDFARNLAGHQRVLFAGSRDDGRQSGMDCGEMAEKLYDLAASQKEKIIYDAGGHGTEMIIMHTELMDKIIEFLLK